MSVFIPFPNIDAAAELANQLDSGSGEKKDLPKLIDGVVARLPEVFQQSRDDAESFLTLALAVLAELEGAEARAEYLKLSKALAGAVFEGEDRRLVQLRLLSTIFGLLDESDPARVTVLSDILDFAQKASLERVVVGQFEDLDSWLEAWGLGPVESSQLYGRVADIHVALPSHNHLGAQFRYKQLQALNGAEKGALEERRPVAESIVVSAINDPTVYQLDRLLDLDIVNDLAIDDTYGKTYDLLKMLVEDEDVTRYQEFQNSKPDYFERTKLAGDRVLGKLRSLIICSIAEETKRIEFGVLQEKLGLQEAQDVEAAVIDAIRAGVLQARIDEENACVHVSAALKRKCSPELWKTVNTRLSTWKDSVRQVLESLHVAQGAEDEVVDDLVEDDDLAGTGFRVEDDEDLEDGNEDEYTGLQPPSRHGHDDDYDDDDI